MARELFRRLLERWGRSGRQEVQPPPACANDHPANPWEGSLSGVDPTLLADPLYPIWLRLSSREQQVAALTCLYYTNGEMAILLRLSVETVREYVRNAVRKFGVRSKDELRGILGHWDFSEWAEPHRPRWIRRTLGEERVLNRQ